MTREAFSRRYGGSWEGEAAAASSEKRMIEREIFFDYTVATHKSSIL
jgi:hypothetical protein